MLKKILPASCRICKIAEREIHIHSHNTFLLIGKEVHRLKNRERTQKAFSAPTKNLFPPNLKNPPNQDLQEEAVLI